MLSFNRKHQCGIVVYELKDNRCLSGLWTYNKEPNIIYNEIARKISNQSGFEGEYICSWIEGNDKKYFKNGILKVSQKKGLYILKWEMDDNEIYEGSGFKIENSLVATYWKIKK